MRGFAYNKRLDEYLPFLLQLVHTLRESVTLKPAAASFRQGWAEAQHDITYPIPSVTCGMISMPSDADQVPFLRSQKCLELINSQTSQTNNPAQCTRIKRLMIRHRYLSEGVISSHRNMAAFAAFFIETGFYKRFDTFLPRDDWQSRHTASTSATS